MQDAVDSEFTVGEIRLKYRRLAVFTCPLRCLYRER